MRKTVTIFLIAVTLQGFSQSLVTDSLFGINGTASAIEGGAKATKILRQTDDKIIVAGNLDYTFNDANQMFRVTACGDIDSSFGVNGFVHHTFEALNLGFDYALQPDGKILCCGIQGSSNAGSQQFPFVARYNSDGSVDSTFGTNGSTKVSIYGTNSFGTIFLMPDGKILCSSGPFAMRFLSDGSVDATFGNNGGLIFPTPIGFYESYGYSNVLRTDGIIIGANSGLDFNFSFPSLGVFAYDTLGVIDSTFGTNGYLQDFAGGVGAHTPRCLLQSDDKVVIAGTNPNGVHITRVTTSGQIDTTFGTSGYVDFSPGAELVAFIELNNDRFFVEWRVSGVGNFFKVFERNGVLDTTFTINGSNTSMGALGITNVALVEANGDITFGATSWGFPYTLSRLVTMPSVPHVTLNGTELNANVNTPGSIYQWLLNGNTIPDSTGSSLAVTHNGTYSVIVTNTWGCEQSGELMVDNIVSGIEEAFVEGLSVYPNPTSSLLHLTWKGNNSKTTIELLDMTGREVLKQSISELNDADINVQQLAKGMYLLQVSNENITSTKKISIE